MALLLALCLLLLTVWAYWPGISGPELLDDRSSLLVMGDIKNNPELAWDYVLGDTSGLFGRSVSMGSFVLEKLYLDEGIVGSKKVNIVLHAINGGLLIWLLWLLFRFLGIPGYQWLAVILGAIWLLHPLLVSTVLYAVQRMAMLATFFMLAASISYVYWRLGLIAGKNGLLRFLPVPLLIFIGLLAKENAIVLVPVLLLMQVLWFEFRGPGGVVLPRLRALSLGLIVIGASALLLLLLIRYEALVADFSGRPFSLAERLLTESRIVWDYVGQWFAPQVTRMGLYHDDVVLSRSLSEPASTQYAVLSWLVLALVSVLLLRWRSGRWLVFGIAWFLLGHSVESTVLPLELYFEHRNYFPAIGLLIGVGALFAALVNRWPEPAAPALVCLAVGLVVLAALTSSQVQIWSSRPLLILSQLNAHPDSSRANTDMAVQMANSGQIDAARHYSMKAFESSGNAAGLNERFGDYEIRNLALSCLSNRAVSPELIDKLGKVNPDRPLSSVTTLLTMVRLLQENRCPEFDRIRFADRLAEIFLVDDFRQKASANIYSNLAVLENALGRYDNAYAYVERFLALSPGNKRGLLMKLHFSTALGKTNATREAIATLQQLDRQGKLTVGEQQTLGLYLEK